MQNQINKSRKIKFLSLIFLISLTILAKLFIGLPATENDVKASSEYDWEVYCLVDDKSSMTIAEFEEYSDDDLKVEVHLRPLGTNKKIAVLQGLIDFNPNYIYDVSIDLFDTVRKNDSKNKPQVLWKYTEFKTGVAPYVGIYSVVNDGSFGINYSFDDNDTLAFLITFSVDELTAPVESFPIGFFSGSILDIDNNMQFRSKLEWMNESIDKEEYDESRIKYTPFWVGEPPEEAAEPDATLSALNLNETNVNGDVVKNYIENFSPTTMSYDITIPYAVAQNGLLLEALPNKTTLNQNNIEVLFSGGGTYSGGKIRQLSDGETVTIKVTDPIEPSAVCEYIVNVTVNQASSDTSINKFIAFKNTSSVQTGTLTPALSTEQTDYTLTLPFDVTTITVLAEATNQYSTMLVTGLSAGNILNITTAGETGAKAVTVKVTAEDGTQKTYNFTIMREEPYNVTDLASVKVNGNLATYNGVNEYEYQIPEDELFFNFQATLVNSSLQKLAYRRPETGANYITITSGSTIDGKTSGGQFTIVQENQEYLITLKVTPQAGFDGYGDPSAYKEYVLRVKRAPSTNTALEYVKVKGNKSSSEDDLVQGIAPNITLKNYTISPNDSTSVRILAYPAFNKATVTIYYNGQEISTGSNPSTVNALDVTSFLPDQDYEVQIKVTAQDTSVEKIYTFKIIKLSGENGIKSVNTRDANNPSQSFDAYFVENTHYTYDLPNQYTLNGQKYNINKVSIIVVVNSTNIKSLITSGAEKFVDDGSGTGRYELTFTFNNTYDELIRTINFTITAQDGTTKDHVIQIKRAPANRTAFLDDISINSTTLPEFIKTKYQYTTPLIFERTTSSVYVSAKAEKDTSSVFIRYKIGSGNFSESIENALQVSLVAGISNRVLVEITVVPQSGVSDQKVYTFEILAVDTNYELQTITLESGVFNFGALFSFDKQTNTYNIPVPYSIASVKVFGQAVSEFATVIGASNENSSFNLTAGALTTIEVYVRSEAGVNSPTKYKLNFTRSAASKDVSLSSLQVKDANHVSLISTPNNVLNNYYLRVNANVLSLSSIEAVATDVNAQVIIPTELALNKNGLKTFSVTVIAEDRVTTKTYYIEVACADIDNTITKITVNGVNITFDSNFTTELPAVLFAQKNITIVATMPAGSLATLFGNGEKTLDIGDNTFEVYAVSQYDTLKSTGIKGQIYTIKIVRNQASKDATLSSLQATTNDDIILSFDKTFVSNTFTYNLVLNKNYASDVIKIEAVATAGDVAKITGIGAISLNRQPNGAISQIITVKVTAEDGSSQSYTITVTKESELSNDASISSILISGGGVDYPADFDGSNKLTIKIPYNIEGLQLLVTPTDSNAQVKGTTGFLNVAQGQTKNFTFYVQAQDGTVGQTYTLTIERAAVRTQKELNYLAISYDGSTYPISLTSSVFKYTYKVTRAVTQAEIIASVAENSGATISDGSINQVVTYSRQFSLNAGGELEVLLTVTAENNQTQLYTIIIVCKNSDSGLKSATLTGVDTDLTANFTNYTYQTTPLDYYIDRLTLTVIPNDSFATISGSTGEIVLSGQTATVIKFKIVAEDGSLSQEYTIVVNRKSKSDNNNLQQLQVLKGAQDLFTQENPFDASVTTYNFKLNRSVTKISFFAKASHKGATISGAAVAETVVEKPLVAGQINKFSIYVTAENGQIKEYIINIEVKDDNNSITNITIDGQSISFSQSVTDYVIETPYNYNVLNINIQATLQSSFATANGAGIVALKDGKNTFVVYAVAENGVEGTRYNIEVKRNAVDKDSTLSSLCVFEDGSTENLVQNFNPSTLVYSILLTSHSTAQKVSISAAANSVNATVVGTGLLSLTEIGGTINNTFIVKVTAQDGSITEYTVVVLKNTTLSDNAQITNVTLISSSGEQIDWNFNYLTANQAPVTLKYDIAGLNIQITTADGNAVISGGGFVSLSMGETKTFVFYATAQNGTTKSLEYKLTVTREQARALNSLNYLSVTTNGVEKVVELSSDPDFVYRLTFDRTTTQAIINATVSASDGSAIFVNSIKQLTYTKSVTLNGAQEQIITITVQAENGANRNYTIALSAVNSQAELDSVIITGAGDKNGTILQSQFEDGEYSLGNVGYGLASITLQVIPKDLQYARVLVNNGQVTGAVTINLKQSANVIKIKIIADDQKTVLEYSILVTRDNPSQEARLQELQLLDSGVNLLAGLTFSPDVYSYTITCERSLKSAQITATAISGGAQVMGLGVVNIIEGVSNTYNIFVKAEDGITQKTYVIVVLSKDSDNKITDITVDNDVTLLTFDAQKANYTVNKVFDYNVESIEISAQSSQFATLFGTGTITLKEGTNVYEVYAVSERGEIGTKYKITITRTVAQGNNYLSMLRVTDTSSKVLNFSETFNKIVTEYTVVLPTSFNGTQVIVEATPESQTAIVTGTGLATLKIVGNTISTVIEVKVTAQNGQTQTYRIMVVKTAGGGGEESNDYSIKNITLTYPGSQNLLSGFDPSIQVQPQITIPYSASFVQLRITAHQNATKYGEGAYNIDPGQTITIEFYVVAANGLEGTVYTVDVTRQAADEDNSITNLSYECEGVVEFIDAQVQIHTITLSDTASDIIFNGEIASTATATGLGEQIQLSGNKTHIITVVSQSGKTNTYIINILLKSTNSNLYSIKVDNVEKMPDFVDGQLKITVPYASATVTILASAQNSKATVAGNGTFSIEAGAATTFEVYGVSEMGESGQVYSVIVTRLAASDNGNLLSLEIKNNANGQILSFSPAFSKNIKQYTLDLTALGLGSITELLINAQAESLLAQKVTGTGVRILQSGTGQTSETLVVTVTAENGNQTAYNIIVTREVRPEEDITINSLSLIGSDGLEYLGVSAQALQLFENSKYNYTVNVPYNTKNATLSVVNKNKAQVVFIAGGENLALSVGDGNVIIFKIVSENGMVASNEYTITIVRQDPSSNNDLEYILNDGTLVEGFNKDTLTYTLSARALVMAGGVEAKTGTILIDAKASDNDAVVAGSLGQIVLNAGVNTLSITVTAQNGSKKVYTLIVELLSNDNTIYDLAINDFNFDGGVTYNKELFTYTLTVPYSVERVEIIAAANQKATLKGTGYTNKLQEGLNTFTIYAISQFGSHGQEYMVKVIRTAVDSDASLKSLIVSAGGTALELKPGFIADVLEYNITLYDEDGSASTINSVFIEAVANSTFAVVEGTGYRLLKTTALPDGSSQYFHNILEVNVRAQNGTIRTYVINIYRNVDLADDITFGNVTLIGSDGITYLSSGNSGVTFDVSTYTYVLTVPHTIRSVTLNATTISANVYGIGTQSFGASEEVVFNMKFVSQSGAVTSNSYKITVRREVAIADSTLKNIIINGIALEGFDPNTPNYSIDVPFNSLGELNITATTNDSTAKIVGGMGKHTLQPGENIITILVQAQDGSTRSYTISASYLNNDARLKFLNLEGRVTETSTPIPYQITFNPDVLDYTVIVDKSTCFATLKPETFCPYAAVRGLVKYEVGDDGVKAMITVVAADNFTTKTYVVNIIKDTQLSGDAFLSDLNVGGHTLKFNPLVETYTLSVGKGTSSLDVNAIARDANATVTILGSEYLEAGKNVVLVQVTAENGSSKIYQLIVNKDTEGDMLMTVLLIAVFVLWLITAIILVIKSQQDNSNRKNTNNGNRNMKSQKGTVYFYADDDEMQE